MEKGLNIFLISGLTIAMLFSLFGNASTIFYAHEMVYAYVIMTLAFTGLLFFLNNPNCKSYTISLLDFAIILFVLYIILLLYLDNFTYFEAADHCKWGAMLMTYWFIRNLPYKRNIYFVIVCLGVIEALTAILQMAGYLESQHIYFHITGHLGNPGPLGGFLAVCTIIALHLNIEAYKAQKKISFILLSISSILLFFSLILSDSRAAYLGVLTGIFILLSFPKQIDTDRKKWKTGIVCLCVVLCASILFYLYRPQSANARLLIWKVTIEMITEKPLSGHGIGSFPHKYMLYQARHFCKEKKDNEVNIADNISYAYNEILHLGADAGGIGIFCILLIIFCIYKTKDNEKTAQNGLIVWGVFSLFSYPSEVFPLLALFPIMSGCIKSQTLFSFQQKNMKGILVFFCLLISIYSFRQGQFYKRTSNTLSSFANKKSPATLQYVIVHHQQLKSNITYHVTYLKWLACHSANLQYLEMMQQIIPNSETYVQLGKYYQKTGKIEKAKQAFIIAADMVPSRLSPNYNLWHLYLDEGDTLQAIRIASKILSQPVKVINSFTINAKTEVSEFLQSRNDKRYLLSAD